MSKIINELLPPDLPSITRWRLVIAGSIVALGVQAGAAYGAFAWAGIPGFASKSSFDEVRLSLLEERIYSTKRLWCQTLQDTTKGESRRFYNFELARMHLKYYQITGTRMDVPSCEEVGP